MFKNMKIAITLEQPLDEVVRELERLGYRLDYECEDKPTFVITWVFGIYDIQSMYEHEFFGHEDTVTLTQLKEMK